MVAYLHGVETVSSVVGARKIEEVRTAIIGLTGTAPIHHVAAEKRPAVGTMQIVRSESDLAQFGPDLAAYTIPAALKAFIDAGVGPIIVANVFDPEDADMKTVVGEASKAIVAGAIVLADQDIISVTVKMANDTACAEGDDFTVDYVAGVITVVDNGLLDGEVNAKVAYVKAKPSGVVAADIIGATDEFGVRSGAQLLLGAKGQFGLTPKILIAPGYSGTRTVAEALLALAQKKKLRARAYVDAPVATTVTDAIAGRSAGGNPDLGINDGRVRYCFPHVRRPDGRVVPYSTYVAAVRARTDLLLGYWFSLSNKAIPGISGLESVPLSSSYSDEESDTNRLNGAGITTVLTGDGGELRTWGNRTAAYPAGKGIETFESVDIVRDVLEESLERASIDPKYGDAPITQALIDSVLADTNAFARELIGRGALLPGSGVTYDPAKNPSTELAAGHITWTVTFCPPPPLERQTFDSIIDTNLLKFG